MASRVAALIFAAGISGCATVPPQAGQPALLMNGDNAAVIEDISQTVSKALGGVRVLVGRDSFAERPSIVVDQAPMNSIYGDPRMGQIMKKPDHFSLSLMGNKCVITHDETGASFYLKAGLCKLA